MQKKFGGYENKLLIYGAYFYINNFLVFGLWRSKAFFVSFVSAFSFPQLARFRFLSWRILWNDMNAIEELGGRFPLPCLKFDPLHGFVFFEPGDLLFGIDAWVSTYFL